MAYPLMRLKLSVIPAKAGIQFVICLLFLSSLSSAKVNTMTPYAGIIAGAWHGPPVIETDLVTGLQAGLYGPALGASFSMLYYHENIRLAPLMFNAFYRLPLLDRNQKETATLRVGGGASYLIIANNALSEIGAQANLGADYWFKRNAGLGLDIIYLFLSPAANGTDLNLHIDSLMFLVTWKYRFGQ